MDIQTKIADAYDSIPSQKLASAYWLRLIGYTKANPRYGRWEHYKYLKLRIFWHNMSAEGIFGEHEILGQLERFENVFKSDSERFSWTSSIKDMGTALSCVMGMVASAIIALAVWGNLGKIGNNEKLYIILSLSGIAIFMGSFLIEMLNRKSNKFDRISIMLRDVRLNLDILRN